jgi:methylaspartate ammonia-lyase
LITATDFILTKSPPALKITDVLTYHGWGGYFFEDIDRIRKKYIPTRERYHTVTAHKKYPFVRTPAPVVGVGLQLNDGSVHWGDAVAVSFGGKAGRSELSKPDELERWFHGEFHKWCLNRKLDHWLGIELQFLKAFGSAAPFIRYAVSQALLAATSHAKKLMPFKVIANDLGLKPAENPIPLQGSSGANFSDTVDRMLARKIMYLPQGQFEHLSQELGPRGDNLLTWITDFKKKAAKFGYKPTLTLDFHGALDDIFQSDTLKIANFIVEMAKKSKPHALHVESPVVGQTLKDHTNRLKKIRETVKRFSPGTRIIADEWANEVRDIKFLLEHKAVGGVHIKMPDTGSLFECGEAIAACKKFGAFTLLGGSCTETDLGAKASAQLALAFKPDALLVKPGMGFDESYALMFNEMKRSLTTAKNSR